MKILTVPSAPVFKRIICPILILGSLLVVRSLGAAATAPDAFGPYEALVRDQQVVTDVRVDGEENVFLKLNPDFRNKEIRVRISMQNGAAFRKWFTGEDELVSPAFAGKEVNGWTDRVQTTANYIEYWMDGRLILHLHRTSPA